MPSQSKYDVIILGGGAAGLFCAFTAAQRGRRVLVLERANKVGKKILMSGGGRCNFTNYVVEADNFISANPHFCKAALKRFTQWDFIDLVERYEIAFEERKHSQLFCHDSARDILNLLLEECRETGVEIRTSSETETIEALPSTAGSVGDGESRYRLSVHCGQNHEVLDCHSLVIATGGLSIPTLGGSGLGYDVAKQFGLAVGTRDAGLVPFMFTGEMKALCERLSGIAHESSVSCRGQKFTENILFTHRGLSGPAILQISNYWYPGDAVEINLMPGTDAVEWLLSSKRQRGKSLLRTLLAERLPKRLVTELQALWWANDKEKLLADFTDQALSALGNKLNAWLLKPSATEGYRTAEVTRGGVDTSSISSKTMEAKNQPGLYFVGEVLDVTGWLGGFNFQWAWSSGYAAGQFV